jgi:hypothetical protein
MQIFMMPVIEQGSFLTLHKLQFQVTLVRPPSNMQKNPKMAYSAGGSKHLLV